MRSSRLGLLVVVASAATMLLSPTVAHAASCSYGGADLGTWDLAGNWTCGHIPNGADDVTLSGNRVQIASADESAQSLTFGSGAGLVFANSHTLTVSGGTTWSGANQKSIDGAGTLSAQSITWTAGDVCIQSGATLSVAGTLTIPSGAGTLNCNGGSPVVKILAGAMLVQTGTPAGSRVISTPLDVDGSLEVQAGTLILNGSSPD